MIICSFALVFVPFENLSLIWSEGLQIFMCSNKINDGKTMNYNTLVLII